MGRKILVRTSEFPYHITNRSNNKEFFYLSMEDLWKVFVSVLKETQRQFQVEIYAFVLMSNHYHLILSTPLANLGAAMLFLHREVARKANKKVGRINHFFGGRYKWCVINNERYYWNAVKYVFRNPVAAGICKNVEDYEYSSLRRLSEINGEMLDFFYANRANIDLDLEWLNQSFTNEQKEAIGKALRRREFKLSVDKSRKKMVLESMQRKKGTGT